MLFVFSTVMAQAPPAVEKSTDEEQKTTQELEKKALALVNEILDGAQMLKLPDNRAYVFASAANLLWKSDEKRARVFFASSLSELANAMKSLSTDDSRNGMGHWQLMTLRQRILVAVARHDGQFALDLLYSTREAFSENLPLWGRMMDQELALEQTIAGEVAAKDPKRALQLAQESLAKGVSYNTLGLLWKLQSKDIDAANTFAGDVIKKLGSIDFSKSREAGWVAQELLRNLVHPEMRAGASKKIKPLSVEEPTIRELTDVVLNAALNSPSDRTEFFGISSLLPDLEKRSPERVVQLRRKLAENNEKLDPNLKMMMQYHQLTRDGKPEAIIEAAAKAPPDMRNHLYQSAVEKLKQNGDLEAARKVVLENMSGEERDRLLSQLDEQLIAAALKDGKMEEARKLIARITPNEARLAQLAHMATGLMAKGDQKTALALLEETESLVNRAPDNQREIDAMLQVARAYAMIEPMRAFGILEPVIDQANAMLAAAAVLEKFGADRGFFKDGEFRMQESMEMSYTFSTQYKKEMMALAKTDFARTRALADRFQRDEARLMARILIAKAVLGEKPEEEAGQ
jgi:hypothetical protein